MAALKTVGEILESHLANEELSFVERFLFGGSPKRIHLDLNSDAAEVKGYSLVTPEVNSQGQRLTRLGLCQLALTPPQTASVRFQKNAAIEQGVKFIKLAANAGVQIFCFQELWTMPMGFCTGEKLPWVEYAEDAHEGETVETLKRLAKEHDMVIISPILERDANDEVWNSAVVIDATGELIGTYRKCHIPIAGNESVFFRHSNQRLPVFQTKYGVVGVNICYDRHFAANWFSLGLSGSEVVFNPCASVGEFSEHMWAVEARAAAISNGFYVAAINRAGTETFIDSKGGTKERSFYGSSYVASPTGACTPGLSTTGSGLLVVKIDLAQNCAGQKTHHESLEVLSQISDAFHSKELQSSNMNA